MSNRVGVLTTSYPRWAGDFAGAFVEDAVQALAATGVDVDVVAAAGGAAADGAAAPGVRPRGRSAAGHSGVRVHRVAIARPPAGAPLLCYGPGAPEALEVGGLAAWVQAASLWSGMCDAVRALGPSWDGIHAHWLVPCGLVARAVAPRVPLTIWSHSGDVALLERMPGGRALARYLVAASPTGRNPAPAIRFVTRDLKDRFARLMGGVEVGTVAPVTVRSFAAGAEPTSAASSGSGVARARARRALGLPLTGRTVLSVGRLVPIKGFDVLVRAVAASPAASPDPHSSRPRGGRPILVIVGDGPERPRLAELARRLDVDLRLPGFVPRAQVPLWMAGADLYVQPSRRLPTGRTEGLPVSTLEALAQGLPVVASATGGLTELALRSAPTRLRLVPPDDAAALAACLEL